MDMYPKKSRYVCTYVQFNAIFERGPQLQLGKLRQSRQTANQPSCQNHEPLSFLSCHVMSCHASSHLVELADVRTFHVRTYNTVCTYGHARIMHPWPPKNHQRLNTYVRTATTSPNIYVDRARIYVLANNLHIYASQQELKNRAEQAGVEETKKRKKK